MLWDPAGQWVPNTFALPAPLAFRPLLPQPPQKLDLPLLFLGRALPGPPPPPPSLSLVLAPPSVPLLPSSGFSSRSGAFHAGDTTCPSLQGWSSVPSCYFRCLQLGHYAKEYSSEIVCRSCHLSGHVEAFCPRRPRRLRATSPLIHLFATPAMVAGGLTPPSIPPSFSLSAKLLLRFPNLPKCCLSVDAIYQLCAPFGVLLALDSYGPSPSCILASASRELLPVPFVYAGEG